MNATAAHEALWQGFGALLATCALLSLAVCVWSVTRRGPLETRSESKPA